MSEWNPSFWISEWKFSEDNRKRIANYLPDEAISDVERAVAYYLAESKNDKSRPRQKEAKERISKIAYHTSCLSECLDELDNSEISHMNYALKVQYTEDTPASFLNIEGYQEPINYLHKASENFKVPKGRKKDYSTKYLCYELAEIWNAAHGKWPKRSYDAHGDKETGPLVQLIEIIFSEIAPEKPLPTGILKDLDLWIKKNRAPKGE